jgi:beta-fructofuranosidase
VSQLRPGFRPRRGWVNDPHGIVWHDGRYHLFFQQVRHSVVWRPDVSWGHAVSTDLRSWTEQEPVLEPDREDAGCWSGCVVTAANGPVAFYTSVLEGDLDRGRIRAAVPVDESWSTWRKTDLLIETPEALTAFRDPFVLRDGPRWRMVVGAGLSDGAALVSFVSDDLWSWTYDGVLASRCGPGPGRGRNGVGECPQLVEVDGRWALLLSLQLAGRGEHVAYAFGTLRDGRFAAGDWHRLTHDERAYAASTFRDAEGRLGAIFWLRGVTGEGWAGALSAPYLLGRDGDRLVLREREA